MKLRKLTRSQQRAFVLKTLKAQGGMCPLCELPIDHTQPKEAVLDHCHETGECRGVLHRSCNGALGKMDNAIGRWGAKSMTYAAIIPFLRNALAFYEKPGLGWIYPEHKNPEERAEAARIKRNKAQVKRRADIKAKELV